MFHHEGLDHIAIHVRDMETSIRWYKTVLGLEDRHPGQWNGVPTMLVRGSTAVALFPTGPERASTRPTDEPLSKFHFAFRVDGANFKLAQGHLKELSIPFVYQNHQICESIYFRDPDGHEIEITTYDVESTGS